MKYSFQEISWSLFKTLLLLLVLDVICTTFLPAIGVTNFRPSFNVLIILFLAFKVESPLLAFIILIVQYFHSAFSIEGWGLATFVGILVSLCVRYVKDMLSFSSFVGTIIVVQISQILWFVMTSLLISLKQGDFSDFFFYIGANLPETIFLSLVSHFFFKVLDNFWDIDRRTSGMSY